MSRRHKADGKYFFIAWAVMTAVSLPFVFGFGYLAGGVLWGAYAAVVMACGLAVSWMLIARR